MMADQGLSYTCIGLSSQHLTPSASIKLYSIFKSTPMSEKHASLAFAVPRNELSLLDQMGQAPDF